MILKNCPICGGESVFHINHRQILSGGIYNESFIIKCKGCQIQTKQYTHQSKYEDGDHIVIQDGYGEAANFWNNRVNSIEKSQYSSDEMALVNKYSRHPLKDDDVYLFTAVLCDNDIDNNYERFTLDALLKLSDLFVGKTGNTEPDHTAKFIKARIISCRVEKVDGKITKDGKQFYQLIARAYILRTKETADLIAKIESGEIKDVHIGCSVRNTFCSICEKDMRSPLCNHIKGKDYYGELCFGELNEPLDAYEFSFTAVPSESSVDQL